MKNNHYKYWKSIIDLKRCIRCKKSHGQIYEIDEEVAPAPPIHERCRCVIAVLEAIIAGKATNNGMNGADLWLKEFGKLPPYCISESEALGLGWKN